VQTLNRYLVLPSSLFGSAANALIKSICLPCLGDPGVVTVGNYEDVIICEGGMGFGAEMCRLAVWFWVEDEIGSSKERVGGQVAWERISRGPVKSRVSSWGWRWMRTLRGCCDATVCSRVAVGSWIDNCCSTFAVLWTRNRTYFVERALLAESRVRRSENWQLLLMYESI
jgi:hypothetical protein